VLNKQSVERSQSIFVDVRVADRTSFNKTHFIVELSKKSANDIDTTLRP